MMKKHISAYLDSNISSHSQIEFVDIVLNSDTKLFIDPCLIDTHQDKWALAAQASIGNYFEKFYNVYRTQQTNTEKFKLFFHTHEINATKLGYGNGNNGKAKTPEGMVATFSVIDSLFSHRLNLSKAVDLPLFISGFAEDCLSDMLTNIIFKVLNEFTLEQCEKFGFASVPIPRQYYYWDCQISDWMPYQGKCLCIDNKVVLLVPKWFIRQRYYYNTSQYFSMVILSKLQKEKTSFDADGKELKPTKKSLKKEIIHYNKDILSAAIEYTGKEPSLLTEYHNRIPRDYADKGMDDEMLDEIIYGYR